MPSSLRSFLCLITVLVLISSSLRAQERGATASVPRLISYSGIAKDADGRALTGLLGVTFALYEDETGGAPVWLETQNVQTDARGHYTVTLGASQLNGLPSEVFTNTEARWLGVQVQGQGQQSRVMLLAVPYALKAADAETIGGLPPSAFVLATPAASSTQSASNAATGMSTASLAPPPPGTVSGTGTANFIPLWTDSADIANSVVFQSGTGSTAKIGVNTTTPAATLDVKGAGTIRGLFSLPSVGVATAAKGSNSQPAAMTASAFNSSTSAAVNENFRWQAEPAGNNTASPSATLNLLFGSGTTAPVETGLKVSNQGVLTFATGQTFPGTGTISGVTAGSGLTGGGTTGNVTLNLDTTQIPQLNVANTFTGNQTVSGNLSATGAVTGSSFLIGSNYFAFGSLANSNAFLGFGGSLSSTGTQNTAVGALALALNTTGAGNTATGYLALTNNSSGASNTALGVGALNLNTNGSNNTASGNAALQANTTGSYNTANGLDSLLSNTTGSFNSALGYLAGPDSAHPNLTNSTAIGAEATVTASNSIVLGSIAGVNGAGSNTNVGIGTTAPAFTLDVHGTGNFTGPVTFTSGQTFPNTISGVTAGTALTGGGTTGNVTLNLDTTKIPQLNASNTFVGTQTVTGNLSATGVVTGSSYQIGSTLFAFGSVANNNSFLGFSGNTTTAGRNNVANGAGALGLNTSGSFNAATGVSALADNTTGSSNVANGFAALESNTLGASNTADGTGALISNTTGIDNTATGDIALGGNTTGGGNTGVGFSALANNTTGIDNTALGFWAGPDSAHPDLTNATAIGANALVTASNALVLGSTGVNVGIGTSAPAFTLDVHGNGNFTGPITFAPGQTFPGAGTITGITPGTALTGGGSSGSVTLNVDTTKVVTGITAGTDLTGGGTGGVQTLSLDTTKVPQLNAANTFTGSQTVTGNLTATGTLTGSAVEATSGFYLGSSAFAFGSASSNNAYLGYAGTFSTTGSGNSGIGWQALAIDTTGNWNSAIGDLALRNNISGSSNVAVGAGALENNSSGSSNTAVGFSALGDLNGGANTALGFLAASDQVDPNITNSTAIGAYSDVTASNSLVLGSISGVNDGPADTNVGIGTTAPSSTLDVEGTAAAGSGPILLFKNKAAIATGTTGNAIDLRFAPDGGSNVVNPNAIIRVREDGNNQYGAFMSFATMADGGAGAGALERMRIAANGFVGVGVTAPAHIFQVGQGLGNAFADGWSTYSSRRWKTNIQTLPNALAKVEQLRGVSYELKGSGKHEIGVIAEEVGEVVPEVVSFEENGKDAQGVDYSRLTALLIEGMKQQQRQIQEQSEQIAKLNRKVGLLETALRTGGHAEESTAVARSMKGTHNSSSNPGNVTSQPGN